MGHILSGLLTWLGILAAVVGVVTVLVGVLVAPLFLSAWELMGFPRHGRRW